MTFFTLSCNKKSDVSNTIGNKSPRIIEVVPQDAKEGSEVAIVGKNFSLDKSELTVLFDSVTVEIVSSTESNVVVEVPQTEKSLVQVTVIRNNKRSNSVQLSISMSPIPIIDKIVPDIIKTGNEFEIIGKNFPFDPNKLKVKIDGQEVDFISNSDTSIKVMAPESGGDQITIQVLRNGKASDETTVDYLNVKTFSDNFNREDVAFSDKLDDSHPIGENWTIFDGEFGIKNNRINTQGKFVDSYVLFDNPNMDLRSGKNETYKISVDIKAAEGILGFSGVILNAQDDGSLYYLRTRGDAFQLVKSGEGGLSDITGVPFSDSYPDVLPPDGFWYHIEVVCDAPGHFDIQVYNKQSGALIITKTVEDDNDPYVGGLLGLYFEKYSSSADILFDNFVVEIY